MKVPHGDLEDLSKSQLITWYRRVMRSPPMKIERIGLRCRNFLESHVVS